MPDYGDILKFLAANPPQHETERKLHASLLELMAQCLRTNNAIEGNDLTGDGGAHEDTLREMLQRSHIDWVHFA